MGYLAGVVLIVFGLGVLAFGDKHLKPKEGAALKVFSMPPLNAKVLKWAVAGLCIWFGVALLLGGGKL